jgi:formate dehydrogenase subunit delta
MAADRLVYMANQIGRYFATQPRVKASEATADHLRKFWDPRMRSEIKTYLQEGGSGLDSSAREAVELLIAREGA